MGRPLTAFLLKSGIFVVLLAGRRKINYIAVSVTCICSYYSNKRQGNFALNVLVSHLARLFGVVLNENQPG